MCLCVGLWIPSNMGKEGLPGLIYMDMSLHGHAVGLSSIKGKSVPLSS